MSPKDIPDNPKHRLLDDLKSIKGVLDDGDDNIPLLDDAEADIPVLADEEDIPVLGDVEAEASAKNKASLQAALKELESLELSPKSSRSRATIDPDKPIPSLEDKIRASAAPPLVKIDQPAGKENPFLAKKPQDKFDESRKQAEAALQSVIAHSRALGGKTATPAKKEPEKAATLTVKDDPSATPVDFTPATKAAPAAKTPTPAPAAPEASDGADDILRMLGENKPVIKKGGAPDNSELEGAFDALVDIDLDDLGEMDVNDDSMPELPAAKKIAAAAPGTLTEKELNLLIDEIVEECSTAFNIMLEKKLKEKLSRLLKK